MSLLDLLDQYQGRGISLPASSSFGTGAPSRRLSAPAASAPVVSAIDTSAANSRERGAPERVDINNYVPQATGGGGFASKLPDPVAPGGSSVPFQVAEVAGKAPGFVMERPLALVGELTQGPDGAGGVLDAAAENPLLKFVGEAWANVSGLPAALINNKDAITLKKGFAEGWQDGDNIHANVKGAQAQTWADFKAEMVKKGYTDQDILDLQSGRKQTTDFGDHRMSGNDLAELALRFGTDPTNLLLGAGVGLKAVKGIGFLAKAMDAGIVARRFATPALAAEAAARGVGAESTLLGMSRYLGTAARGGFSAYKKVALGTTGAQLGVGLADKALNGDGAPKSGFLEGLFEFNRSMWDNQPLSNSSGFSILSAFAFNPFHGLKRVIGVIGEAKYRTMGASVREEMIRALQEGESWGGKRPTKAQVLARIGGEDALDNLLVHSHAQIVMARLMENPAIADSLRSFKSQPEIILANHKLKEMIEGIIVDEYQRNIVKGRDVVQSLKDWHANRSGVKTGGIEFQWDGALAIDRWNEYGAAVSPVSKIFHEQGTALLGLVDAVMAEDLRNVASALRIASGGGKDVGIAELRKHISRFPQLAREEGGFGKYLLPEWNGKRVPVGPLYGRLTKLAKDAPTARSITGEFAAAEWKAGREEYHQVAPQTPTEIVAPGGVMIGVSRMRPSIARRIKMTGTDYASAAGARSAPEVAAFEHRAGSVLAAAGLPVSRVDQAIGSWQGSFEPALEVGLRGGTIEEIRLTAALLGHAGSQDGALWAATGRDMARLGVNPNGYEIKLALPDVTPDQLSSLSAALHELFPGWTLNDTIGAVRILVPGGTEGELAIKLQRLAPVLEGLYPTEHLRPAVASSIHPAYIEFLSKKKGDGDGTYADAFRAAKAAGDGRGAAADRFKSILAHRDGAAADAAPGGGPDASVGRSASDAGRTPGDLSKSPAERVGVALDWVTAKKDPGYVYHATSPEAAMAIGADGLRPQGPEYRQGRSSWQDGGTGRRSWFVDSPVDAVVYRDPVQHTVLTRVRVEDAGHVRRDVVTREPYSMRRIPAQLVEIYGADGAWHPMDSFYEPVLPADLARAAETTIPVFQKATGSSFRGTVENLARRAFNLSKPQARDFSMLVQARAEAWSRMTGQPVAAWYETHLAGIESGGPVGEYQQILKRQAGIDAVTGNHEALRVLIEEPEPPILAEYGLGGSSELEWIPTNDVAQQVGIPGGVAGLADQASTFTLWDLWRLKSQGIDPRVLPESVRVPLYSKLFRTQTRALTNKPDVFNRMAFAMLSPRTKLTANEALLSFVRAQDEAGIARLAELADQGGELTDIGFRIQQAVGLDNSLETLGFGIKSMSTNRALGSVGRLAQFMRDHGDYFLLREGEDLLEYSERIMNVTPGAGMKVGNFSAMLGAPESFSRGTIDSHMIDILVREGRLSADVAKRLGGQAPSAQSLRYRLKDGSINPEVPAHLHDLPVEPKGNKVLVYGGDYRIANEALKAKFEASGRANDFGLGAYQWYEWDLERGKFEPHTAIYPGSHELPPIELGALSNALKHHQGAGYLSGTEGLVGAMSPTDAFFYQKAGAAVAKGSAQFLEDGRAMLRGFATADVSTALHELAHVHFRELLPEDLAIIQSHGLDSEGFARAFERWARDGKAPTPALQGAFERFRGWLTAIYAKLKGSPIEARVHPEVRGVINRLYQAEHGRSLDDVPPTFDPTPDATTSALRAMEDGRPANRAIQAAYDAGDTAKGQQLNRETAIARGGTAESGGAVKDGLQVLDPANLPAESRIILDELFPEQETLFQRTLGELDSTDPERGRQLFNAALDAEATAQFPLHRSLQGESPEVKAELGAFEEYLRTEYPAYTLQKPPHPAISIAEGGSLAAQYLRNRTALGNVLAEWGPLGNANRLIGWLRTPVRNSVLGRAARQALMNELIPHGAKPAEVQQFLAALDKAAALQEIGPHDVRVFRNGGSMTPKAINKIAAGDPEAGVKQIFSDATIKAIGRDNFARILDRSGNRFIRTLDATAAKGGAPGALARGLAATYDGYSHTAVGGAQRLVSKTLYHWFRFMSDPRWWAMNVLEADMIGGLKFGAGSTRFTGAHKAPVGQAALTHQFGRRAEISQDFERALGDSNGWLYTRRLGGYISRSFDHERPESTLEVLHSLAKDDHVLADLRNVVSAEDALAGRAVRTAGEIADEDLVGAIDRMLYSFDEKGAKATILDEARQILGPDETLRLMPFLQKVYEANDKTYRSIVELFHGNPERTNIERIANSYWLYWPLSYQIKATKWLVRVLGEGAFGQKTNLAGAALYAHHVQQHRERMAKDASYASLFEDHPTAWFLVQMMFPVTPVDIGVSLSRPLRYAGGALGIWGEYKNADDPISAAGAVLSLGPVYTSELLARLGRELYTTPTENLITQPANNLYPQQ